MDVAKQVFEINAKHPNDAEGRLAELIRLWNSLENPKEDHQNSYLIVSKIVAINLMNGNLQEAWSWAQNALLFSENHSLTGESEFLVGKVAFEMGNLQEAGEYFKIVNKKSGVRLFKEEKPEYLELLRNPGK